MRLFNLIHRANLCYSAQLYVLPSSLRLQRSFFCVTRIAAAVASSSFGGTFDPYRILGVTRDTNLKDIKKAYYRLALKYHPDNFPEKANEPGEMSKKEATEKFIGIQEAWNVLKDGKPWHGVEGTEGSAEAGEANGPRSEYGGTRYTAYYRQSGGGGFRYYSYEEPGSTTESYFANNRRMTTILTFVVLWCAGLLFLRVILLIIFPLKGQMRENMQRLGIKPPGEEETVTGSSDINKDSPTSFTASETSRDKVKGQEVQWGDIFTSEEKKSSGMQDPNKSGEENQFGDISSYNFSDPFSSSNDNSDGDVPVTFSNSDENKKNKQHQSGLKKSASGTVDSTSAAGNSTVASPQSSSDIADIDLESCEHVPASFPTYIGGEVTFSKEPVESDLKMDNCCSLCLSPYVRKNANDFNEGNSIECECFTDRPCQQCSYRICYWCYRRLVDVTDQNNLNGISFDAKPACPACREPYCEEWISEQSKKNYARRPKETNRQNSTSVSSLVAGVSDLSEGGRACIPKKRHMAELSVLDGKSVVLRNVPSDVFINLLLRPRGIKELKGDAFNVIPTTASWQNRDAKYSKRSHLEELLYLHDCGITSVSARTLALPDNDDEGATVTRPFAFDSSDDESTYSGEQSLEASSDTFFPFAKCPPGRTKREIRALLRGAFFLDCNVSSTPESSCGSPTSQTSQVRSVQKETKRRSPFALDREWVLNFVDKMMRCNEVEGKKSARTKSLSITSISNLLFGEIDPSSNLIDKLETLTSRLECTIMCGCLPNTSIINDEVIDDVIISTLIECGEKMREGGIANSAGQSADEFAKTILLSAPQLIDERSTNTFTNSSSESVLELANTLRNYRLETKGKIPPLRILKGGEENPLHESTVMKETSYRRALKLILGSLILCNDAYYYNYDIFDTPGCPLNKYFVALWEKADNTQGNPDKIITAKQAVEALRKEWYTNKQNSIGETLCILMLLIRCLQRRRYNFRTYCSRVMACGHSLLSTITECVVERTREVARGADLDSVANCLPLTHVMDRNTATIRTLLRGSPGMRGFGCDPHSAVRGLLFTTTVINNYLSLKVDTLISSEERGLYLLKYSGLSKFGYITDWCSATAPENCTPEPGQLPVSLIYRSATNPNSVKWPRKLYDQFFSSKETLVADSDAEQLFPLLPRHLYWFLLRFSTPAEAVGCVAHFNNENSVRALLTPAVNRTGGDNSMFYRVRLSQVSALLAGQKSAMRCVKNDIKLFLPALAPSTSLDVSLVPTRYCDKFLLNQMCTRLRCMELHSDVTSSAITGSKDAEASSEISVQVENSHVVFSNRTDDMMRVSQRLFFEGSYTAVSMERDVEESPCGTGPTTANDSESEEVASSGSPRGRVPNGPSAAAQRSLADITNLVAGMGVTSTYTLIADARIGEGAAAPQPRHVITVNTKTVSTGVVILKNVRASELNMYGNVLCVVPPNAKPSAEPQAGSPLRPVLSPPDLAAFSLVAAIFKKSIEKGPLSQTKQPFTSLNKLEKYVLTYLLAQNLSLASVCTVEAVFEDLARAVPLTSPPELSTFVPNNNARQLKCDDDGSGAVLLRVARIIASKYLSLRNSTMGCRLVSEANENLRVANSTAILDEKILNATMLLFSWLTPINGNCVTAGISYPSPASVLMSLSEDLRKLSSDAPRAASAVATNISTVLTTAVERCFNTRVWLELRLHNFEEESKSKNELLTEKLQNTLKSTPSRLNVPEGEAPLQYWHDELTHLLALAGMIGMEGEQFLSPSQNLAIKTALRALQLVKAARALAAVRGRLLMLHPANFSASNSAPFPRGREWLLTRAAQLTSTIETQFTHLTDLMLNEFVCVSGDLLTNLKNETSGNDGKMPSTATKDLKTTITDKDRGNGVWADLRVAFDPLSGPCERARVLLTDDVKHATVVKEQDCSTKAAVLPASFGLGRAVDLSLSRGAPFSTADLLPLCGIEASGAAAVLMHVYPAPLTRAADPFWGALPRERDCADIATKNGDYAMPAEIAQNSK